VAVPERRRALTEARGTAPGDVVAPAAAAPPAPRDRWPVVAVVVGLMVVGTALRVVRLGHQSLWNDEIVTYISAHGTPWRVLTQREENSNILPLYYLVANAALPLRRGLGLEAALRLPSVLAGVLSIPLLFLVVRRWLGDETALLAAALMTIAPFHIWYSQEARPYALLLLLSLVAVYCLQRALARPGHWGWGWGWGWNAATAVATASTFYCHTIGIAFTGFAGAYVLVATSAEIDRGPGWWARLRAQAPTLWHTRWRAWALTFLAVALLCLPGIARLASFPPTTSADSTRAGTPAQLGYALWSFAVGYSLGPSPGELHTADRRAVLLQFASVVLPVAAGILTLAGLGAWMLIRRYKQAATALALWFICPLAFAAIGALVTVHPFNVRYAIISFLPMLVAIVAGLSALGGTPIRAALAGGAVVVCAIALDHYFTDPKYARDDNRGAAAFLTAHARPGDLVIAHRAFTGRLLSFYAPAMAMRVLPFPSEVQSAAGSSVLAQLDFAARRTTRVWLFLSRGTAEEEAPLVAYCDQRFRRDDTFVSSGVRLLGYARDPSAVAGHTVATAADASAP
jgi:mannosyltransferase